MLGIPQFSLITVVLVGLFQAHFLYISLKSIVAKNNYYDAIDVIGLCLFVVLLITLHRFMSWVCICLLYYY
jgi:hypothetical protein